jgi:hypothetical protein
MLLQLVNSFPCASLLLQGLGIIVKHLRLPLHSSATLYHHSVVSLNDELADVPIGFVLPAHSWMIYNGKHLTANLTRVWRGDEEMGYAGVAFVEGKIVAIRYDSMAGLMSNYVHRMKSGWTLMMTPVMRSTGD